MRQQGPKELEPGTPSIRSLDQLSRHHRVAVDTELEGRPMRE